MNYLYYICDVFTDTRFGGNQLAVLPQAQGLSDRQMQQIAREFKFLGEHLRAPRGARAYAPSQDLHAYSGESTHRSR